jgi:hypothetical protein
MTLESANICSKLLSLGVGEAARLPPIRGGHGILRRLRSGRTCRRSQPIALYGCAHSDQYRNVFVSVQKHFFLGTSILDLDHPNLIRSWEKRKWTLRKPRSVPTRSVRAWRRRASTAVPSVKQRKRHRRSLARVHTPDAKARRTSHHIIIG